MSETAKIQKQAEMSTSTNPADLEIQSTPNTATGVTLSGDQKIIVGSVLDLFKGLPTLKKLQLWTVSVIK